MEGVSKLVEFLLSFFEKLIPCWIIDEYERGVCLWLGRPVTNWIWEKNTTEIKELKPGFYFKVPFLHKFLYECVVTTTLHLPSQSLTTKDGKCIIVKSIVKYNINDIRPFMLKLTDRVSALSDISQGKIKEQTEKRTWAECNDGTLDNEILKKIRLEVKKWGIDVEAFTMTSQTEATSYKIFNDPLVNVTAQHENEDG